MKDKGGVFFDSSPDLDSIYVSFVEQEIRVNVKGGHKFHASFFVVSLRLPQKNKLNFSSHLF